MLRQLAGRIARQSIDHQQRTRQKHAIHVVPQMIEEGFRVESGSDHGRREPLRARQAAAAGLAQEKTPSRTPGMPFNWAFK